MDQFKKLYASLSLKQKISIGIAALAVVLAIVGLSKWHKEQDFKPLYTGVAPEDAAVIVQKIKESGTEYRLSDTGGVISVPSGRVAELRLEMAAAGLPKSGRIGFELFDKTTFGATEFVEHINYNRALEGELERSVGSLSAVEQARVHITEAKESVFVESREQGKASVIIKLKIGASLLPKNVIAIQQLVASAVEGLSPDDVSVVDTRGTLLSRRKSPDEEATDVAFERRQRIEHDLLDKINATLEPLLGRDRFRAGVTVECDLNSADQSEETFDPNRSVMTNSQKTEEVNTGSSVTGIPGTASNLPRPVVRPGGPTSTSSKRTENISYESSHLVRKMRIPEGAIKHMSVSVLLDQRLRREGKSSKLVAVPPAPETIKAVHDLIAGITGFEQDRGDQIVIESLPFEATLDQQDASDPSTAPPMLPAGKPKPLNWKDTLKDPKMMMGIGGGVLLLALLGVGAMLFLRKGKKAQTPAMAKAIAPGDNLDLDNLEGVNLDELDPNSELAKRIAEQKKADLAAVASLKASSISTKKTEMLTREVINTAKKDPAVSAHVLQTWLHEED
jgi:flagellar M-ring protein FliF